MMDLLTLIDQHYHELTGQERQMVTDLRQVELTWDSLTSNELAKKLYVSRASIFRMLKKLEIESFAELKYLIQQEKQSVLNLEQGTEFSQIVMAYHTYIDQVFTKNTLRKVADLIQHSEVLYLYGTGNEQKLEVEALRHLLTSLGKRFVVFFDHGEYDYVKENILPSDLLIMFSYKGENHEAIKILQDAQLRGSQSLVFTRTSQNTMAQLADHQLYVPTESIETPTRLTYEISTTFYFIIDQLFFECLQRDNNATRKTNADQTS